MIAPAFLAYENRRRFDNELKKREQVMNDDFLINCFTFFKYTSSDIFRNQETRWLTLLLLFITDC